MQMLHVLQSIIVRKSCFGHHSQRVAQLCTPEVIVNGSAQGMTWHSTCSTGFSIAEASNFFNAGFGVTIAAARDMYKGLLVKAAEESGHASDELIDNVQQRAASVYASLQMFQRCKML